MAVTQITHLRYIGLSTDTKPIAGVVRGARFLETDHNVEEYVFDGSSWVSFNPVITQEQDQRVHNGQTWIISSLFEGVSSDAFADIVLTVPASGFLLIFLQASEGAAFGHVYEGPTVTGGTGTSALVYNAKRSVGQSGAPTAVAGQTVTDVGTELLTWYNGGGTGGNAQGGGFARDTQMDITEGLYLYRLQNKKGSAADMSWELSAYESE